MTSETTMVRSDNQLQVIVAESGLEPTKGAELLKRFEDYFSIAAEWETRAKAIIITDDNCFTEQGKFDMQSARNGRLFLRDKRIAIEKARKELKEQSLREGRAIDGIANVLKALIVPIEKHLEKQEHFVEIKAKEEAARIGDEMREKAEADRVAREQEEERARLEEEKRIRDENERLQKEAKAKDALLAKERKAAEKKTRVAEEKARKEREALEEKARVEREERERIAEEKQAKYDADRKALEEKARKDKAAADAAIAHAKAEQARLLRQIQSEIECPHCHKKFKLA